MIFHHMTFATAGLLHALFEIVYDLQHNVRTCTTTTYKYLYTHTHTHTLPGQPAALYTRQASIIVPNGKRKL